MVKEFYDDSEIIDWSTIEEYENEGTNAGHLMALAECDKLLNYLLQQQSYRGKTIFERIKNAKDRFSDLSGLASAMEIKENVFSEYDKQVTIKEVEQAVSQYKTAIKDIASGEPVDLGFVDKIKSYLEYQFLEKPGTIRRIILWFFGFVFLIILLDTTHFGQGLVHVLARFFSSIFSWLISVVLVLVGVAILVILTIVFLERRKKQREKTDKLGIGEEKK
jgi:ABC-type multidrug transport system permease subunit